MITNELKNASVEERRTEEFGKGWIQAITAGALDRLAGFCDGKITGRLLIPSGLVSITNVGDLIAEYRDWFGECSDFTVEMSRVAKVGERLGISYQFLLQDHGEWYRIEQHLFCVLKDEKVQSLYLLCSGFQPIPAGGQPASC